MGRTRQVRPVAALICLVAASVTVWARPAAAADVPLHETRPTGLHGGGFVNVVAFDPFDPLNVLAGGDNSGLSRSSDRGVTWEPVNDGTFGFRQRRVASVAFSPTQPGTAYAAVGDKGQDSALYVSTDHGSTWTLRSTVPRFSGANNSTVAALPSPHPRSTGNLLAFGTTPGVIFAATFDTGLMRSTDGGTSWQTLGLAGAYLRGIVRDTMDPDTLYVASFGAGVYRVTDASGSALVTALAGGPTTVEELTTSEDGTIWAATGAGVARSADGGATWIDVSGSLPSTPGKATRWMSIATSGASVFAGSYLPPTVSGRSAGVVRSDDGGTTWQTLGLAPGSVTTTLAGTGEAWWYAAAAPGNLFAASTYVAAHLAVSPDDPALVLSAGRGGIWRSADTGAHWQPAVAGLAVTENSGVAVDPTNPSRVVVANTDWVVLHSEDAMATVARNQTPAGNDAFDATFAGARLLMAVGNRDDETIDGEIWSTPDVTDPQAWVDEGLSDATGGLRPIGVASAAPGGQDVILAAVAQSGVWRKANGTWTRIVTPALTGPQVSARADFEWVPGTPLVYLFDRGRGVWRSLDAGVSWTRVWGVTSQLSLTGDIAVDPTDPGRVWVSTASGLFRLDGATAGTVEDGSVTRTTMQVAGPGPVAIAPSGLVYVAGIPGVANGPARLYVSGDAGATWTDAADDRWRGAAAFPIEMAVGTDGVLHVTTIGNGNVTVRPKSGRDHVTVRVSGGLHYDLDGAIDSGDLQVSRDADGLVGVNGRATVGTATINVALKRLWIIPFWFGTVGLRDPASGFVRDTLVLSGAGSDDGVTARMSTNWFAFGVGGELFTSYRLDISVSDLA